MCIMNRQYRAQFYLSIWQGAIDPIIGQEINLQDFSKSVNHAPNPIQWAFKGKYATVYVIAPYGDFNKQDALKFATDWMLGKNTEYAVDLDRCIVQIKQGVPKTPRY
jgi:hypothetical protein